jgi:hypothetical protein
MLHYKTEYLCLAIRLETEDNERKIIMRIKTKQWAYIVSLLQ